LNTINVIRQEPNLEIELWNSITKIVKLKEDIPELDVTKALELVESEIKRIREKGEILLSAPFTINNSEFVENKSRQEQTLEPRYRLESEDTSSTFEEATENYRKKYENKYDKLKSEAKIGEHVRGRHSISKFSNNPWNVGINVWALCDECGVLSIQTLAIHVDNDGNMTHVYKAFEHPNEKKKSHWVSIEHFQGRLNYKQILKQKMKNSHK